MLMAVYHYAQTQGNSDSLYKELNNSLDFNRSKSSEIVWERVLTPEGKVLRSFNVENESSIYIGCEYGGVYEYLAGEWYLLGLEDLTIAELEINEDDDLLIVSNDLYRWDGELMQFISSVYTNPLKNLNGVLFGAYGKHAIRSFDNGFTWDTICVFSAAEMIRDFTSTSYDSIFIGTTNYVGEGGGVYISTDGGDNWSHFGLSQHFIKSMAVDNFNKVYAGNNGHWETGQGGLYRYNYEATIWDTLHYFPYITSIVFNSENHIYTGFNTSGMADWGGVMHSEDNGETWILDTTGIGNTMVNELQMDNNGFLYALAGYPTNKLYRTTMPVNIKEVPQLQNHASACFPNPAGNYINITFEPVSHKTNVFYLTIYNVFGQSLINKQLSAFEVENGRIRLDISHLSAGCYVVNINGNNFSTINTFTKH